MSVVENSTTLERPGRRKNAKWSREDDAVFIDLLTTHQSKGNQSDNGWKKIVWTACEEALRVGEKQSGGGPKTASGCKDHWLSVCLSLGDSCMSNIPQFTRY
jgi:hypothetical protein